VANDAGGATAAPSSTRASARRAVDTATVGVEFGRSPSARWVRSDVRASDAIARLIAWMSDRVAPSVHAAYALSIVVMVCPCCFATHSGLLPLIRFQLTDECRAQ